MLRAPSSRTATLQPFICWKCRTGSLGAASRSIGQRRTKWIANIAQRGSSAGSRCYSTSINSPTRKEFPLHSIREYFRQWEVENPTSLIPPVEIQDMPLPGQIQNLSRVNDKFDDHIDSGKDEEGWNVDGHISGLAGEVEDIVADDNTRTLTPGDLAMLRLPNGREVAGIFLGKVIEPGSTRQNHPGRFFLVGGQWVEKKMKHVIFHVPGFAKQSKVDAILPYMPSMETLMDTSDNLSRLDRTVPGVAAKHLIKKLQNFLNSAASTYQANSYKLDTAHEQLSNRKNYKRIALQQAADVLLGTKIQKNDAGLYPAPALYAVHIALVSCEFGIQCQLRGGSRFGGQYEVAPRIEFHNVSTVVTEVRQHLDMKAAWKKAADGKAQDESNFSHFIEKSRRLIDRSRKFRDYTPHGAISPFGPDWLQTKQPGKPDSGSEIERFSHSDIRYIRFLELWAGSESFSLQSLYNGIGSLILRETERYRFDDTKLDMTTAWTFLQEIGAISPWANRSAQMLRLEKPRHGLGSIDNANKGFIPDTLQAIRKDWGELTVYCIDAETANELDDGISVEATDVADEHWVHIHTADPASRIRPDGNLAKLAESKWQTAYFADAILSMLPNDFIQKNLSLGKGKPCLTFSARLDGTGKILETRITSGRVQNVVFLTPTVLGELIQGSKVPVSKNIITVGPKITRPPPARKMLQVGELSSQQEADLKLLNKIGEAHANQRFDSGGLQNSEQLSRSLTVSSEGFPLDGHPVNVSYEYRGDPTIHLEVERDNGTTMSGKVETVQNIMLLAGNIAAQWCHERGIPIPFRISVDSSDTQSADEYYRNVVRPSLDKSRLAPANIALEYRQLLGSVALSSTPSRHRTIGLDKYSRCTSPLRRYEDMLVHWQVQAALQEEHRTGKSLVGNTRDDFLPFTKERMDEILPTLSFGEMLLKQTMRLSDQTWLCKLLLRAWKSGNAGLPPTFDFIVDSVFTETESMRGIVPFFLQRCMVREEVPADFGPIKEGDVLEVEIKDINVHKGFIEVRVLGRLDSLRSQSTDVVGARSINYS